MLAYDSIQKLVEAAEKQNKSISEVCLEDQAESMGLTKEEVFKQMEEAFDVMVDSVKTGMDENLRSTSGLTGGEGFKMLRYANQKRRWHKWNFYVKSHGKGNGSFKL